MDIICKNALPENWDLRAIGDFVSSYRGGAPLKPRDFVDDGIMVLPKKAIGPGGKLQIPEGTETFCSLKFAEKNKRSIATSEYLITTLRDLVPSGPAIGYVVRNGFDQELILAQGVYAFIVDRARLNEDYLIHISNSDHYRRTMKKIMVGSTQVHIRTGEYFETRIPVPAVEEQARIAKILGAWDQAIDLNERLIEALKLRKKGLMQRLLTGEVRYRNFQSNEWNSYTLVELVEELFGGGTPSTKNVEYWKGEIPWITGAAIEDAMITSIEKYITSIAVSESSTRIVPKGNILLVSRTGVGKIALAPCDIAISQDFTGIIPNPSVVTPQFLFYSLQGTMDKLQRLNQGTSINGIKREDLKKHILLVPKMDEQKKITDILVNCDKEITMMTKKLELLKQQKKGLMQRLLTGQVRVKLNK